MKLETMIQALNAKALVENPLENKETEYMHGFASDLMSDALALIQMGSDSTVLLTGLANTQSLRTAEMLDINLVIYVRAKRLPDLDLDLAKEMGISVYSTECSMYEACGKLYALGLPGLSL